MAFNYDDGKLTTVYYNTLKFLKQADGPQKVKMIRTGSGSGQSTLVRTGSCLPTGAGAPGQSR